MPATRLPDPKEPHQGPTIRNAWGFGPSVCAALLGASFLVGLGTSMAVPSRAGEGPVGADKGQPIEMGQVGWGRDLAEAKAAAATTGRPLFVIFQEIPGCSTCQNFGRGPLSHPLVVEAIETEFVPVLVYNNRDGEDGRIRQSFGEPAWNNPVVRFLNVDGDDLIARRDGVWSTEGVVSRMVGALEAANRPVPAYLRLAQEEAASTSTKEFTLAVHCFWEGAAAVGGIDGITGVEAAFLGGREVIDVTYVAAEHTARLLAEAIRRARPSAVYVREQTQLEAADGAAELLSQPTRRAPDSDQLYYLRHSPYAKLELTKLQQIRVNAALGSGGSAEAWLSPRQRARLH
ncbi:MAG: VPGUxxT family thioredoxin-like (seleno)protein, type 2 [Candidatus Eisenbacteria bacterium]